MDPKEVFWSDHYRRHNQRRQEHLASLGLPLDERRVLEVGAGIGDHTSFFHDRGCSVTITEAQEQNLAVLRGRYSGEDVRRVDLNAPPDPIAADVVYCYGTLYHLEHPAEALAWLAACADEMLLLETCVAADAADAVYPFDENSALPENAANGRGCRPTRRWLWRTLAERFEHVYVPWTQPWHEEFPLDWSRLELLGTPLIRAVFIASRRPIVNGLLVEDLPMTQVHEAWELLDAYP